MIKEMYFDGDAVGVAKGKSIFGAFPSMEFHHPVRIS